jgi:hypothetical protein
MESDSEREEVGEDVREREILSFVRISGMLSRPVVVIRTKGETDGCESWEF